MSGINTNYTNNGFNYPQEIREPIDENKISGLGINEEVAKLEENLKNAKSDYDKLLKEENPDIEEMNRLLKEIEALESEIDKLINETSINSTDNNNTERPQDTKPLTGLFSLIREQTQLS